MKSLKRTIMHTAVVLGLTVGGVGVVASAANAASYTNEVYNCYGIMWNTDWNQNCGSGGADEAGYYYTKVDCTGADNTRDLDKYRRAGNSTSYDGDDCIFGINYDEAFTNWRD